jgi:predicted permease
MWRDLRFAARSLWRSPTFTLTATLALGLAIGANGAIFSLVDGLWFRPPGVRDPGDLVRVIATTRDGRDTLWSYPDYESLRDATSSFAGVVAIGRRGALVPGADGRAELVLANVVSRDFFTVLGIAPLHGRLFGPADAEALEQAPGIVLGHDYWRRQFGADPSIVGTMLRLNRAGGDMSVRVLGVLPAAFRELDAASDRDLWMPPETWARLAGAEEFQQRDYRWFDVLARRRQGVSIEAARAEVLASTAAMARDFPEVNRDRSARVVSDFDYRLETGGTNAAALVGLVLLVVLITCVNIANLLMARASGRSHELALRVALGANRRRLLRQLMAESTLVGIAGAGAGLLVAMWLIRFLPSLLVEPPGFRAFTIFEIDQRVVGFTLGVALVTTLLFGLAPSWFAARTDVAALIKGERAARRRRAGGFGGALVVAQVAVSLVLLSAAGALARSFVAAGRADLGFDRAPMLTAWSQVSVPAPSLHDAVRRLEALPDVRSVAVAIRAPLSLSGGGLSTPVAVPDAASGDGASGPAVKYAAVGPGYFRTMGVALVSGRPFTPDEESAGEPVAIVSEQFASRFFPGQEATGRMIAVGARSERHRIVGVAEDAIINDIGEAGEPYLYLPYWRRDYGEITFLVATTGDPARLAPAVRAALIDVDPTLEPRRLLTMAQYIEYSARAYRATAALAMALGTIGLFLTAIGVYGVIAHRTARRVREIGIRIALGAARSQVFRLVFHEGARIVAFGLVIGVPAALVVTHLIRSLLFGISPWDAYGLAGAAAVLCLAVAAATFVPAWRATRVSPAVTLRDT